MNKSITTNLLLGVASLLLSLNLYFTSTVHIATPTKSVSVSPSPVSSVISWNQQGIPVVRGEYTHYNSSDGCVILVIDQPVITSKSLESYVDEYTSPWSKSKYPRYPTQYSVSHYESITLDAMNAEEISNTFVKVNNLVYKITSNVGIPEGPPRCLQNYDQAISELFNDLNLDSNSAVSTSQVVYLKSAYAKSNKRYIDADYIEWAEDPSAPNGYIVNNNSQQIRTLLISPSVKITLLDWTDKGMVVSQITFDELVNVVNGTSAKYNLYPNQPFDITLDKDNIVTSINLRYTP